MVVAYVGCALRKKKKPDLAAATNIAISAVGATGAVRLIGSVFTGDFMRVVAASNNGSWWSLSAEDAIFVFVGGLALGWVSCQAIWQGFAEI